MRAGVVVIVAFGSLTATPAVAQRLRPLPPPPVSLDVPHPIPSVPTTPPRDLYQQLTPQQPMVPIFVYPPGLIYGPSVFVPSVYTPSVGIPPLAVTPPTARGGLRFETSPGAAQVFVDGFYVGTIDDFGVFGRSLDLEAGLHRVKLRATEYATLAFEVRITLSETTRFRGNLQRLRPPPPATGVAAAKATYIIPHCYTGDRPPARVLPRGCRLGDMQVQTR